MPKKTPKKSKNLIFVVQKHQATRLHYDFRLEKGDVLKSWAIPKEPPTKESIKRLAIQVEDHSLGYEDFEGEIAEGLYGAGTVEIWDKGYYIPVKFQANKELIFELKGKKLKGTYCLIKLQPKNPQDKNWLFFKKKTIRR
jgi:DNA ligase D-like protein (predicted 3'-phosphoesterase)